MTKQELLKRLYNLGRGLMVHNRVFYVIKARTCRNCHFYDDCPFEQKLNPHYNIKDFKNNKNRYKLKPDGYCIPVKNVPYEEFYVYWLGIKLDKILK